jgi:hypothetical protein
MKALHLAAATALALPAPVALAQTETEEEQLVFMEVAGSNVQVPASFVAAVCGLTPEQVTTDFVGTTDRACSVDEEMATELGLMDDSGERVDLSPQGFANVQRPDNDTRVQLPLSIAAQLCEMEESELVDHSMSERLVACDLSQEQLETSNLPGLRMPEDGQDAGAATGEANGGENAGEVVSSDGDSGGD